LLEEVIIELYERLINNA